MEDHTALSPRTNPVCHVVHMKLKGDLDQRKLAMLLHNTRKNVPGLIELHFGRNDMQLYRGKTESPHGNTHALFSRHENAGCLKVYQTHPDHVALAKFLLEKAERDVTVVDFVNIPSSL